MASSLNEEDLATHGRNAWANFQVAYRTLEKDDSTLSEQADAAALRSEMQRFQLWAINLGLFYQDHSSLDYRLRDNEIVRSFTRELLTGLVEALAEVTDTANSDGEGYTSRITPLPGSDSLRAENDEPLSIKDVDSSSLGPIVMGTFNDESESMLKLHLEDVTEAIDQMFQLASQIRSPRTRKTRTDIDLFKEVNEEMKSEYIKMRKRAELQGIEEILLRSRRSFPESQTDRLDPIVRHEDQYLIQRLQKANHARRQQFEYWRRSKKRTIRASSNEPISSSTHYGKRLTKIPKHKTPYLIQRSEFTRSLLSSASALTKNFVLRENKSTYSGTSRGLTVHGPSSEKLNWPKPPVAGPLNKDFECPFCFYFCPPRYFEDAAWRSHLKHDLRPYVCTYDECVEPNVLYDSWEEWTRHEQWAHKQRVWRCSEHNQQEFVELAAYEDHVRTYHGASMHQLLSSELLTSKEFVSQVCDRPCPFCLREFERLSDLQQHVATHLESIALLSLPSLIDLNENSEAEKANSNSANRNYAESKADDFDHTKRLVFVENDPIGSTPVVTEIETELLELKLKAESISFESWTEVDAEAHQTYSSRLVREWLSHLPHELKEYMGTHSPDSEERREDRRTNSSDMKEQGEGGEYWSSDLEEQRKERRMYYSDLETQGEESGRSSSDSSSGSEEQIAGGARNLIVVADTAEDQQGKISTNHWFTDLFNQSLPSTPMEDIGQPSISIGEDEPGIMARLNKAYTNLLELPFENGNLLVRVYVRPHDGRTRFLCRTRHHARSDKNSSLPLNSLLVSRTGPFLKLSNINKGGKIWAWLKFSNYELMSLFFCALLALRSEDMKNPVKKIDSEIYREKELFAAPILDDDYEHALCIYEERDTGVVRLQASVAAGELKRKPIWTAFITHQIHSPTWMSRGGRRVVCLTHLNQFIFTTDYNPPKTSTGGFELRFIDPNDTLVFMRAIESFVTYRKFKLSQAFREKVPESPFPSQTSEPHHDRDSEASMRTETQKRDIGSLPEP